MVSDDDFFKQLAGDQPAPKAASTDEIVFRDEAGKMKVLKGEEVFDFESLNLAAPKIELIKEVFPPVKAEIEEIKPNKPPKKEVIAMPELAPVFDFDRLAEDIVKKSGLNFNDPDKSKRLKNIIVSRLKNVRDQIEVREILADSPLAGGLGFDPLAVEKISALINEELKRQDSRKENRRPLSAKSLDELFLPLAPKVEVKEEAKSQPLKPLPVVSDLPQKSENKFFELKPKNQPPLQPIGKKLPEIPKPAVLPSVGKPEAKKPKPKEVKFQERLVNPAAEIETMKLADFRRLGKTGSEAAQKILEKIALLEKDSFTKKVQGIKAWRASEIHRLYLEIARQSISENKSMAEVAFTRKQAGLPALTEDELAAVIELNQKLRH